MEPNFGACQSWGPFCCLDLTPRGVVAFVHTLAHAHTHTHTHTHTEQEVSELRDARMRCQ